MEDKKEYRENFVALVNIVGKGTWTREKFGSNWYQEKTRGLWIDVVVLYTNEDNK